MDQLTKQLMAESIKYYRKPASYLELAIAVFMGLAVFGLALLTFGLV